MELISYLVIVCYRVQHTLFVSLFCYRGYARQLVFYIVSICLQTLYKHGLVALLVATEVNGACLLSSYHFLERPT